MPYRQITEYCFQASVGPQGVSPDTFSPLLEQAGEAIDKIGVWRREGEYPLFLLPSWQDDITAMSQLAKTMGDTFSHIVVLGTGGSSLGGQALAALAHPAVRARVVFPDNLDGPAFATLLEGLDMTRTCFVVISKSGGTPETLSQALVALGAVRDAAGEEGVRGRLLVITEPGDNPLRRLAERWSLSVLDHDANLGGRYSVLSLVGLLPAMVLGLDVMAVRRGASQVLEATIGAREPGEAPAAVGAAISVAAFRQGMGTTVLMPYCDGLERFGAWHRQLWAESLGKQGFGSLPAPALGPVDQHSQLQLFLDGPTDKLFTLIIRDDEGSGPSIPTELSGDDEALDYLAGRTIGDLVAAEARATAETLVNSGRPTRTIRIARLDEETMGALFMHFMLETIIAAHLFGVDPFDQPAVETGKALTREYLKEMATAGGLQ